MKNIDSARLAAGVRTQCTRCERNACAHCARRNRAHGRHRGAQTHYQTAARYTEATLLSAMEGAGKLVEDDELRAAMSAKGLGTPATRAAIIEGLLTEKYLIREA